MPGQQVIDELFQFLLDQDDQMLDAREQFRLAKAYESQHGGAAPAWENFDPRPSRSVQDDLHPDCDITPLMGMML